MLLLKFLGIILIVGVCASIGFLKSFSIKARYKKLSLFYDCLTTLYEYIECGGCELEKALKTSFFKCCFLSFQNVKTYCQDNDLTKEDKVLINEFFASLGNSVKKVECERIKAFEIIIKKQLNQANNEMMQKCKIYQTLGICTGLVIGIFLV